MMRIKAIAASLLATCLFFVAGFFFISGANAAPRLYFDPASLNPQPGTDIQVDLLIDVGITPSYGAEAVINVPSEITVKSVTAGGFFSDFSNTPVTNGQLVINSSFGINSFASKTGTGVLAHLTLTSTKVLGSSVLNFLCTSGTTNTFILDSNGVNILACSSLNQLTIAYPNTEVPPDDDNDNDNNNNNSTNGSTNACGGTCGSNYNCNSGLFCYLGYCRNPDCRNSTNCACPTATPVSTKKPVSTLKPLIKPTPIVVTLAKTTPYPSPEPSSLPEETPEGETLPTKDFTSLAVWSGIGLIAAIVIIIAINALRKKNPPQINPPGTFKVDPPMSNMGPPTQIPPPTGF